MYLMFIYQHIGGLNELNRSNEVRELETCL